MLLKILGMGKSGIPEFFSKAEFVLAQIETKSTKFYPTHRFDIISDNADNRLLECQNIHPNKKSGANFNLHHSLRRVLVYQIYLIFYATDRITSFLVTSTTIIER
jgi:hypothetical protein